MEEKIIRSASHAGSWYSSNKTELLKELRSYFLKAEIDEDYDKLKSLIVPHAGYRYSGSTAAWGYININPKLYKRVVLLGPSHHSYFNGCGLTTCSIYKTPLGDIQIDTDEIVKLSKLKMFEYIDLEVDQAEHSLEMQLPYIYLMFEDIDFKLIPIMIGFTNLEDDKYIGGVLSEYYNDPETLFIISSDFCHWGTRFRFMYHNKNNEFVHQSIEELDRLGMKQIESLSADNFSKYLIEYKNTICGRRPISILLSTIEKVKSNISQKNNIIKFVKYDQSEKVKDITGASVSYAVGLNLII